MKKGVQLILLCTLLTIPSFPQGKGSLAAIKKIYVGSMGQSDEAGRFQLLLVDELGKAGFTTTDDAKTADAVLTGVLAVRVYSEESLARVTVVLKNPDGLRLWGKDFQPHTQFSLLGGDTVRFRARDVAKALRKDVEKAGK